MTITFRAAWSSEVFANDKILTDVVTIETINDSLPDVLEAFERFLRGAGFHFEGTVDIVPEDSDDTKEEG